MTEMIPGVLYLCAVCLLLVWIIRRFSHSTKSPNGPWGFPLIGHLPLLTSKPHLKLTQWAERFGPVYKIRMGSWQTIIISGYDAVKDALVNQSEDFAARPHFQSFQMISSGNSITFSRYTSKWKMHKMHGRRALMQFTQKEMNKLQDQVVNEADIVIEELLSHNGPVDPKQSLHVASASIVFSICFEDGQSIREKESFLKMLDQLRDFNDAVGVGRNPVDVMPWLAPFYKRKLKSFSSLLETFSFLNKSIEQELEKTRISNEPRNLYDALMDIVEDMRSGKLERDGLTDERILCIIDDVIGAGIATVISFLSWSILYLIEFPDVQRRVHQEIDEQLGTAKFPIYENRHQMPYCEAVFYETLRYSVALPFLIPHATSRDCRFRGYDIPEGVPVFFNIYSVMRDPNLWKNPFDFDPMRFIDPSAGMLDRNKSEQVIAFGMGRRRCLGEFLARLESYIFFVRLLQRCQFSKYEGDTYDLEGEVLLNLDPKPFRVLVNVRD